MEAIRLRVKDIDFTRGEIYVRQGKGAKDRVTMLPATLVNNLMAHLDKVRALHGEDLRAGHGSVLLPFALNRKYPTSAREWGWQFVFPSAKLSRDPRSDAIGRHHVHPDHVQRAVKRAIVSAQIYKNGS